MYTEDGFWVRDRCRITQHYVRHGSFVWDAMALLPSDTLYLFYGPRWTLARLPRLAKVVAFREFMYRY